jgi:DNA-binding NarL/FixJ family response regulator
VLVVDDHEVFREGLRKLFAGDLIEVADEAWDGLQAISKAKQLKPDVAIIDVALQSLNGFEVVRRLAQESPGTRSIMLTRHTEDAYILEALRAGAQGYVLKTQAFADLTRAIETVMSGAMYLSPDISRAVVEASLGRGGAPADPLTGREREVLQLVAQGRTNKEIAHLLSISIKTVETHRSALMRKLDLHDTASLVRYAIRRGLIRA